MPTSPDILAAFWDRALTEEIGIKVKVNMDHNQFRAQLYEVRKSRGNPAWADLMVFMPNDGLVWIIKKETEMPE